MSTRGTLLHVALGLALVSSAAPALAQDRQAEAAARDALKKARLDAATESFDAALSRLWTAESGCTATRCAKATRAALARDIGVMLRRTGDDGASSRSFAEALALDPTIEIPRELDSADVHLAFQLAREQAVATAAVPPAGDFAHTPVAEQRAQAPVPIHVEYAAEVKLKSVVVKYRGESSHERVANDASPVEATGAPDLRRVWVGVVGSVELAVMGSGSDVCKLDGSGLPASGELYCTTPYGADFPSRASSASNDLLAPGNGGSVRGGPVAGNVRVLAACDVAITTNTLVGARVGYVAAGYPGSAASNDGRALKLPLHLELRYTRAFGDDPLSHTGFAPLLSLGAGAAPFDASRTAEVTQTGIPGKKPVAAWTTGGPLFAGVGAGARYAFSPRAAFTAQVIVRGAIGGAKFFPTAAPELAMQYGF